MSQTLVDRFLWSQPRTVSSKSQGLLAIRHCEKEQNVAGAGAIGRQGSTFLGQASLFWLLEISTTQLKGRNKVEKWAWTALRWRRPPKTHFQNGLEWFQDHAWKLICIETEKYLQGGESLSIKRYLIKAQVFGDHRTLDTTAGSTLDPGAMIFLPFFLSFCLLLFNSSVSLFSLSPYCFIQISQLCAYTGSQGITYTNFHSECVTH